MRDLVAAWMHVIEDRKYSEVCEELTTRMHAINRSRYIKLLIGKLMMYLGTRMSHS